MNLMKQIKGFMAGLIFLIFCSLLMEQLAYLLLLPGYWWKLIGSPVFWSLFSAVCFLLLWRLNRNCPEDFSVQEDHEQWRPKRRINPTTGLPMVGGIDASGTPYGGCPESGLIKPDNFWLISR